MNGTIKDPDLKYLKTKMRNDFGVSVGKVARFGESFVIVSASGAIYLIEHHLSEMLSIPPLYEIDLEEIEEL